MQKDAVKAHSACSLVLSLRASPSRALLSPCHSNVHSVSLRRLPRRKRRKLQAQQCRKMLWLDRHSSAFRGALPFEDCRTTSRRMYLEPNCPGRKFYLLATSREILALPTRVFRFRL